ncbi:Transglutaminase-like superfamily protein [uncultured archaeon]|nr:Transglutaminase-like superfamily protein [uncultured archaeon]
MGRASRVKKERQMEAPQQEPQAPKPKFMAGRRIAASAALVLGLAAGGLWHAHKPSPDALVKADFSSFADKQFARAAPALLGKPMGFGQAAAILSQSGTAVKECGFRVSDQFGLAKAQRMYTMDFIPLIFPPEFKKVFGASFMRIASTHTFTTHAADKDDERVKAIASYIISRENATDPEQAARAIMSWVLANVKMDRAHASVPPLNYTEGMDVGKAYEELGYGKTHSHSNAADILKSRGICLDYTNLISDLLNSVGIPARSIAVSSYGLLADKVETATSLDDIMRLIAHSLVQVNLPSGTKYFDATPKLRDGEIILSVDEVDSPKDYINGRLEKRYEGIKVFRTNVFAALPSDRFPRKYRDILDKGYQAGLEIQKMGPADFEDLGHAVAANKDYAIWFSDAFINAANERK